MNDGEVSHCFDWWLTDDRLYDTVYAEYAEYGCNRFGLPNTHIFRLLEEPGFAGFLKALNRKHGACFDGAHSPWGEVWDLNTVGRENRGLMLKNQRRALEFTAEFEAGVLVIHPGYSALENGPPHPAEELRALTVQALEALLPHAEKLGVGIALENNISPADTPGELLTVMRYFESPVLGCCYDSGHAHEMAAAPGKEAGTLPSLVHRLWSGGIRLDSAGAVDRLAPHMLCCHLHDNDGLSDQHRLPGDGSIDWKRTVEVLDRRCPRLRCVQNEAVPHMSKASIAASCRTFRELWDRRQSR